MFRILFFFISAVVTTIISLLYIDTIAGIWIIPVAFLVTEFLCFCVLILISTLLTLNAGKNSTFDKYSKFFHYYLAFCVQYLYSFCRVKVKVEGIEKIPTDKKFMIVQNHRSNLDPLITFYKLKKYPISMVSKPANFKIPVVGKLMKRNGFISINRENNREAIKSIVRATNQIKNDEFSVFIYPEGTRNKVDTDLLPFKSGAFKIAQKSNSPIVITVIDGSEKVKKNNPWKSTKVTLKILDVIYPENFASTTEMSSYAENLMANALGVKIKEEKRQETEDQIAS